MLSRLILLLTSDEKVINFQLHCTVVGVWPDKYLHLAAFPIFLILFCSILFDVLMVPLSYVFAEINLFLFESFFSISFIFFLCFRSE